MRTPPLTWEADLQAVMALVDPESELHARLLKLVEYIKTTDSLTITVEKAQKLMKQVEEKGLDAFKGEQ